MNHYYKLDLAQNATKDEIKTQYRRLAKEFHPDRNSSPFAQKRFAEISAAYAILSDEKKRTEYDQQLQEKYQQSPFSSQGRPAWFSKMKNVAVDLATDVIRELAENGASQNGNIHPLAEEVSITTRSRRTGSISISVRLTSDQVEEILAEASQGMIIEDVTQDIGSLVSAELCDQLMSRWS